MKIAITALSQPINEVRVGNVYPISGGWGRRNGHLMVLLAITEKAERHEGNMCLFLIIDKEGNPRDVTKYGLHIIEDRAPIAFVDGIDDAVLNMRSI